MSLMVVQPPSRPLPLPGIASDAIRIRLREQLIAIPQMIFLRQQQQQKQTKQSHAALLLAGGGGGSGMEGDGAA